MYCTVQCTEVMLYVQGQVVHTGHLLHTRLPSGELCTVQCTDAIGHGVHVQLPEVMMYKRRCVFSLLASHQVNCVLVYTVQMSEIMVNNTVFVLKQWAFSAINH